jgi:RNA:NAD 2'-phosphotransferase (TPT1/KptA family)
MTPEVQAWAALLLSAVLRASSTGSNLKHDERGWLTIDKSRYHK